MLCSSRFHRAVACISVTIKIEMQDMPPKAASQSEL